MRSNVKLTMMDSEISSLIAIQAGALLEGCIRQSLALVAKTKLSKRSRQGKWSTKRRNND